MQTECELIGYVLQVAPVEKVDSPRGSQRGSMGRSTVGGFAGPVQIVEMTEVAQHDTAFDEDAGDEI